MMFYYLKLLDIMVNKHIAFIKCKIVGSYVIVHTSCDFRICSFMKSDTARNLQQFITLPCTRMYHTITTPVRYEPFLHG